MRHHLTVDALEEFTFSAQVEHVTLALPNGFSNRKVDI